MISLIWVGRDWGSGIGVERARSRESAGRPDAGVVELVDAPDSKSGSVRSVGSIPTARTIFFNESRNARGILPVTRRGHSARWLILANRGGYRLLT